MRERRPRAAEPPHAVRAHQRDEVRAAPAEGSRESFASRAQRANASARSSLRVRARTHEPAEHRAAAPVSALAHRELEDQPSPRLERAMLLEPVRPLHEQLVNQPEAVETRAASRARGSAPRATSPTRA